MQNTQRARRTHPYITTLPHPSINTHPKLLRIRTTHLIWRLNFSLAQNDGWPSSANSGLLIIVLVSKEMHNLSFMPCGCSECLTSIRADCLSGLNVIYKLYYVWYAHFASGEKREHCIVLNTKKTPTNGVFLFFTCFSLRVLSSHPLLPKQNVITLDKSALLKKKSRQRRLATVVMQKMTFIRAFSPRNDRSWITMRGVAC